MTTPLISISQNDLRLAFLEWENEYRRGETISHEEACQTSVEDLSQRNAEHFFERLSRLTLPQVVSQ